MISTVAKTKCEELHGIFAGYGGFGRKNILDARYFAVNRLERKCIKGLSLIFRLRPKIPYSDQVQG
ncbi:hypothetical protein BH18ACI4_BH18ACI4_16800 [soil metagenome]